jgi:argininosuccinate lyase
MRRMPVRGFVGIALAVAVAGLGAQGGQRAATPTKGHDTFFFMGEMNKASIVMLAETGIVPKPLAAKIAAGIRDVIASEGVPTGKNTAPVDVIAGEVRPPAGKRPTDYFDFEAALLEVAGPDASRVHTGRSRQDLESTYQRQFARDAMLDVSDALNSSRTRLLALAAKHFNTIIPAYTLDVQAQPTSLAHYLLALAAGLERDSVRLHEAYGRLNQSPYGAAALGTSGFKLDRQRLAFLLGFDGVVENSYDANWVSPVDFATEFMSVLQTSALHMGQFSQDMLIQYHDPQPWIMLKEARGVTGTSSIMPQKRNPSAILSIRTGASAVMNDAQAIFTTTHNTSIGDYDYRGQGLVVQAASRAQRMFRAFDLSLDNLIIDPQRSLAEVNLDYSTMTEVADTLLREANVPFRIGHHFASELTNYGRGHKITPSQIPYSEAVRIYQEAVGTKLPLTETQFKHCFDPTFMVMSRTGFGGPQPEESKRMLAEGQKRLAADVEWLKARRQHLQDAQAGLDKVFTQLIASGGAASEAQK